MNVSGTEDDLGINVDLQSLGIDDEDFAADDETFALPIGNEKLPKSIVNQITQEETETEFQPDLVFAEPIDDVELKNIIINNDLLAKEDIQLTIVSEDGETLTRPIEPYNDIILEEVSVASSIELPSYGTVLNRVSDGDSEKWVLEDSV